MRQTMPHKMTAKYSTHSTSPGSNTFTIDVINNGNKTGFSHQYQKDVLVNVVKHFVKEYNLLDRISLPYRADYGRERVWIASSHSTEKSQIDTQRGIDEGITIETKLKKADKMDFVRALARECGVSVQFGPKWTK